MSFLNVDKTSEQLTSEMLAELPDTYQTTVGYFFWDFFRAISIVLMDLWKKLEYIAGFDDLTKFEYDDLVKFVRQRRGIIAKTASFASGNITITAGEGIITKGDLFETSDGLQFQAIETKEVTQNDTIKVECLISGSYGNVPIGAISVIPKTIQGIVKISNTEPITGGYEKESKESIIKRYLEDLQKPVTSGNIYHYKKWAKEVTGVGEADVKPLWNGDNTVKIIIINSNMNVAESSLIKSVQDYIDPYTLEDGVKKGWGCGNGQAPLGAYCTVESASKLGLKITFKGILKTGAVKEATENSVNEKILEYLHSIAFNNNVEYISYAQIGSAILKADGIADYSNLLLNDGIDNIPIINNDTDRQIAVLDTLIMEV